MNKIERPPSEMTEVSGLAPDELAALTGEVIELGDAPSIAPHAPLSPSEVRMIMMSLVLTMFLAALDQTIVATALPTIGQQFRDVSNLSWIITAYLLSSTAVAPVYGTLADIYGRRAMVIAAISLFLFGSILCALSPSLLVLILARGLQGLGGGGILPIVQTIIADVVTPRERGKYQAYISGMWVMAGLGGPILGGFFAEHLHWSMIFWINLPFAILSMAMLLPRMGKIPVHHRRRKLDWLGGLLLMSSAVIVLLVLTWGGRTFAWTSVEIASMLVTAGVLAAAFVWHARRNPEPFLPLPLMGGSVVPYAMLAGGCALGTMIGLTVLMPLYYESVYHLTASESGLALIPLAGCSVPGAWAAGRAMVHLKRYKWTAIAGSLFSTCAAVTLTLTIPLQLWAHLVLLCILAFGLGTCLPVSLVSIQNAVARSQVGTATGAMNFFRSLMASFAVALFTAILLMSLGHNVAAGVEEGAGHLIPTDQMIVAFRYVFAAAAVLLASASVLFILMEERPLAGPSAAVAAAATAAD